MTKIALRISNKIKNQNTHLAWVDNNEIGFIKTFSSTNNLPNRFHVEEEVHGGYKTRFDLHYNDGIRPYKTLVDGIDYDSATQKLNTNLIVGYPIGEPLANRTHYAFKIVDLTAQQILDLVESNNQESGRQSVERYSEDGRQIVLDFRLRLFRRANQDQEVGSALTKAEVGKMDRWFHDTYTFLLVGNFRQAKNTSLNTVIDKWDGTFDITFNEDSIAGNGELDTPPMRWLAKTFWEEIQVYFDNQYDM